jgi:hypothetical protein
MAETDEKGKAEGAPAESNAPPEAPPEGGELTGEQLDKVSGGERENLVFTSVSNVLKLRHDTAKNSIGN